MRIFFRSDAPPLDMNNSTSDVVAPPLDIPEPLAHEQILLSRDAASGLDCIIAIHSTQRGPAFGGCRLWAYGSRSEALHDAIRLSEGMSLKNALAGLPFGGGKAVIVRPREAYDRERLMAAFGSAVERAGGSYITAEDVGTTTDDMRLIVRRTKYVSGIPRTHSFGGDPSPKTAFGVFVALEQALRSHLRRPLAGATIAVQGLGAVGMQLCERLHDGGARLVVADIDSARAEQARARFDARIVDDRSILQEPCDVLAPCALGAALDRRTVPTIRAAIVCGAANNQLATPDDGDALHDRKVLYLPDYLVNAGGIISVAREYLGQGEESAVMQEVARIGLRVNQLLERAHHRAPGRVADEWAREMLQAAAVN